MATLYRAWLELTGWLVTLVFWLWLMQGQLSYWQPVVLWVTFGLLFLLTRRWGYDSGALPLIAVLVFLGWIFLARLDPTYAAGHFWGVLVGTLAFLAGLFGKFTKFERPLVWALCSLALLVVTVLFGDSAGGAKAWLTIFGFRFQPVELARIFLVIYFAQSLEAKRSKLELFLVLACFLALLALQRDLGPALLVFLVFCWLSLTKEFTWYKLLAYLGSSVFGFVVAFQWFPHFRNRAVAWLWPWDYLDSKGYQVLQGLFALRAGGALGRGLGEGLVHVIPQAHTDYIFAIIGEELGFLGTFAMLLAYFALAFWALRLISKVEDRAQQLIGLGFTVLLHGQVFLVIGGILRLIPFTGLTLPFVSFGSTSLVAQLWMIGMLTGMGFVGGAK